MGADRDPPARREIAAAAVIVAATAVAVLGPWAAHRLGPHPSREQCLELLDRYTEHVARAGDPDVPSPTLALRIAAARARASESADFARCTTALSRAEAECAMNAHGADEFERCLE